MSIVIIGTKKGGVGKTTVTFHEAFYCAEQKKRVLCIDFDPQHNGLGILLTEIAAANGSPAKFENAIVASHLLDNKPLKGGVIAATPWIDFIPADAKLKDMQRRSAKTLIANCRKHVDKLAEGYDVVLIDLGGSLIDEAAIAIADFYLMPTQLTKKGIQGAQTFMKDCSVINPSIKSLGILPNMVRPDILGDKKALAEVRRIPHVMPVVLYERHAIELADEHYQRPVWETSRGRRSRSLAATEMLAVCKYIFDKAGV